MGASGYLSKLFDYSQSNGLELITKVRKNMKSKLQDPEDLLLLKKRGVIESIFDILKTVCDLEHIRQRNVENLFGNTLPL